MTEDVARRAYASDAAADGEHGPGGRWKGRPVTAALLRVAIAAAPLVVASAVTVLVQLFVLRPALVGHGLALGIVTYLLLAAATITIAVVVERQARRALPLVALLRLSMLFPDQTPSRFQMARSAGKPAALARLAERSDEQGAAAANVLALLARLTEHERRTRGHSERVRVYADLIAEQLGLEEEERLRLRMAAVVHDIGKLSVPAQVLTKPGRPTPEEWATLKGHPDAGIELASAISGWLGPWVGAINEHHERFDGQGYPRGISGEEISLAGRIVAVADAFETMTSSRSYKKAMSVTAARKELTDCAGAHFDPAVVRAFTGISLPRLCRRTLAAGIVVNLPLLGPLQTAVAQVFGAAAPLGSGAVAGLAAGAPANAAAMAVLATSVAIGVVPATAATGPPARDVPAVAGPAVSAPLAQPAAVTRPATVPPVVASGTPAPAAHAPGQAASPAAPVAPPVPVALPTPGAEGSAGAVPPPAATSITPVSVVTVAVTPVPTPVATHPVHPTRPTQPAHPAPSAHAAAPGGAG